MKIWSAILAALVIFAAGVVTGGLTVRLKFQEPPRPPAPIFGPMRQRGDFLDRMQRQLYLSEAQRQRIEQILRDSHERMKRLRDSISPQVREEQHRVRELIRAELSPEQQLKFEAIFKTRRPLPLGEDRPELRPPRRPPRNAGVE